MNLTLELRNVKTSSYDTKVSTLLVCISVFLKTPMCFLKPTIVPFQRIKDREEMLLKQLEEANLSIEAKENEVCESQLQIRSLEEV